MFTGIVESIGKVVELNRFSNLVELKVLSPVFIDDVNVGDSISVNGVCLTVKKKDKDYISFDIILQTLENTNLYDLKQNDNVNLERSLSVTKIVSGHLVTGHVDGVGNIVKISKLSNGQYQMQISIPSDLIRFVASKGSISIDGVSLTVVEIIDNIILVGLTPYTYNHTIFKEKKEKDKVNIEIDLIAKYVDRLISKEHFIDKDFLSKYGFLE